MDTAAIPSPRECARQIAEAFARYNAEFRAITRRAPQRFDTREWKGSQRDAVERIELYDQYVNQIIAALRLALGARAADRSLWQQIRREFATQIVALPDPEFIKTFFSSISRRLFGTVGVAPDIEFVATDLDPLADIHSAVGTNTYVNHGSLPLLIEDLLGDVRFRSPWRDLDTGIAHVASEVRSYLRSRGERRAVGQIEVIRAVFYQM
ncbi:MAG TPA: isocitrate dehydrogenase kinase/phosphatase AceK regulatory subunit, partial [Solirubrobacteraceae bacterium]|nr:isocitrate dehydrogenase kinase/phosphatase AceK regulatory subunit [Solirubrobacteraceae bacterium]